MKDIKVSFVIPVYNTLIKEFESCISSILAVKDIRFEIIVIDDGSQETCAEAYRMYLKKLADERVRLIRQENQGVSAARNKGIENATGVYIMFVDSDDTLYSEKFKPYCGIADIVIYDYELIKGKQKKIHLKGIDAKPGIVEQDAFLWYTLRGKSGFSCGKLYKKSLLNKFGIRFKEGCIQGEDADFNFELMKINPCVEYVDCIIYQYRFSSITAFHRWEKDADKMIYSSDARFRRNMEYMRANNIGSEAVYDLFLCARIRAIYQNAVDLCCVKKDVLDNRHKVEQLMKEIVLPKKMNLHTKYCYYSITKSNWYIIRKVAKLRMLYLSVRGF